MENLTHIINNHSLLIEPLSQTLLHRVIHMYTYFILFFRVLHFYIQGKLLLTSILKHVKYKCVSFERHDDSVIAACRSFS